MIAPRRPAPSRIALVGLRCVGKSTLGRWLAERLDFEFLDLDEELGMQWAAEQEGGCALSPVAGELLVELGVERFRELEARTLEAVLALPHPSGLVLATGGGCVESRSVRERLRDETYCIWLREDPGLLGARLEADATQRPSLLGGSPAAELHELAQRRAELYAEAAHLIVEGAGRSAPQLLSELLERLPFGPRKT